MKKCIAIILIICILMGTCGIVYANTTVLQTTDMDYIRLLAKTSPNLFQYDGLWEITQETPLLSAKNELYAYCFDLRNISGNQNTAYVIITTKDSIASIALFGYKGTSAYYMQSFSTAYYFGTIDTFIEKNGKVINPRTRQVITHEDISNLAAEQTDDLISYKEFIRWKTRERNNYDELESTTYLDPDAGAVVGSCSLQWRKGCAPTAVAMMIKTTYPSLNSTNLIDSLATKMGTTSSGHTSFVGIKSGTEQYFVSSALTAPTVCKWNATDSSGNPRFGAFYNSQIALKSSIDAGYPVGVYCSSSNVHTTGYPSGIGAHMMCGIAYYYSSTGDYITCYTTNIADGAVSFPLTNVGLANRAWFILRWD